MTNKVVAYNGNGEEVVVEFSTIREANMFKEQLEFQEVMKEAYEYEMTAVTWELEKAFESMQGLQQGIETLNKDNKNLVHVVKEHEVEINGLLGRLEDKESEINDLIAKISELEKVKN